MKVPDAPLGFMMTTSNASGLSNPRRRYSTRSIRKYPRPVKIIIQRSDDATHIQAELSAHFMFAFTTLQSCSIRRVACL
jgi:hypothetical protein